MNEYILQRGNHRDHDGVTYKKGDVVVSDDDLVARFGEDKFQLKGKATPARRRATVEKADVGEDVTAEFPGAVEADLKVFHRGTGRSAKYVVTAADDPTTPVHDEDGFTSKKKVEEFLDEYIDDGDEG